MTPNDNLAPEGQPMDGVAPPIPQAPAPSVLPQPAAQPQGPSPAAVHSLTSLLRIGAGGAYAVFILVELFFLLVLPSPTGEMQGLQSLGSLISWGGLFLFLGAGWIAVSRSLKSTVPIAVRQRTLILTAVVLAPGVLLSGATPFMINREPGLGIEVTSPLKAQDFVAPVSVTYSLEKSTAILKNLGYRASKYQWDGDGDGKMDQETVIPSFTFMYPKQGLYTVTAVVLIDGSSPRRIQKRIAIPSSVFSVIPESPVVEKTARFSVSSLLTDPKLLKQITWDFGDGSKQENSKNADTTHTYFAVGSYTVSAVMLLTTNSQQTFTRTVTVTEPTPLPFPITLSTEPANTMGPAPFGAIFTLKTDEPLREIEWDFGDGKTDRGTDLLRAGHTFDTVGIYPVIVRARSQSGTLAELTQIVRVTEALQLPDLRFEGSPAVQNYKIQGEVPLDVTLTPKTSIPLVTFFWESTDSGSVIQDSTFHNVYREQKDYAVTLVAQDADGKVFRQPIAISVKPPSAEPLISALPENGVAPLLVKFDASDSFIPPTETLAGFKWSFGDEDRSNDVELAPARVEHLYKVPGEYTVLLKLITVSGKEFSAQRTIVVRRPPLNACITSSRTKVQAGKGVEFDSACSSGNSLTSVWEVRSDANPKVVLAQGPTAKYVYVFEVPGTYTVSLTQSDQWGNQSTGSVSITVTP